MVDIGANTIQVFDTSNNFSTKWGGLGTSNGEFNMPISATCNDSGYIYILEFRGLSRIQKFDISGRFINSWICGTTYTDITYNDKKIYAVGASYKHIKVVNLISGDVIDIPLNNMSFSKIAYLKVSDAFVLTEPLNNKVDIVNTNGNLISTWGRTGTCNGEFQEVGSISISNNNEVYVADRINGRFQVFSVSGTLLMTVYLPICENCTADNLTDLKSTGISINKAGNVFVSDKYYLKKFIKRK